MTLYISLRHLKWSCHRSPGPPNISESGWPFGHRTRKPKFCYFHRKKSALRQNFSQISPDAPKIALKSGFIQNFLLQHVANGNIYIKSLKHLGTLPLDPTQILQIPLDGDAPFAIQAGVLHWTKSAQRGPKSQNFAGRRSCLGTYIRGSWSHFGDNTISMEIWRS